MRFVPFARRCSLLAALVCASLAVDAQTIGSFYAGSYSIRSLGPVADLPFTYAGLTLKAGDPNTLLIGGNGGQPTANIYSIGVQRGTNNHITGLAGAAVYYASAYGLTNSPVQGGIDGGLAYGPSNVLFYTSYKDNGISQLKPGETNASTQTDLASLGIGGNNGSVGSLAFVPQGFPGAGRLKILSYDADRWYDTTVSVGANGSFLIAAPTNAPVDLPTGTGPEGAVYVAGGNPGFTNSSVIIPAFGLGEVDTFAIDSNGDPIPGTYHALVENVLSVEGATIDPLTGDLLFSTAGINPQVFVVSGFTINPSDIPPVVHLTSPTPGQSLPEPANIAFTANATDADGTVKLVEYFSNGISLGSSSNAPYRVDWHSVAAGTYSIIVRATDNQGAISSSDPITITVASAGNPPTVSLTPLSKTNYSACADLILAATAQDADGQIAKVEFQANGVTIGTSTAFPYSTTWKNLQAGSYTITAKATDNTGLSASSTGVKITVTPLTVDKLVGGLQAGNTFLICIGTETNKTYGIDASTNLVNWTRLTNIVTGTNTGIQFQDVDASTFKKRFYRAQKQ